MEEFSGGDDERRLLKLLRNGGEFNAHIFTPPAFQPDGSGEDGCVLLIVDDVLNGREEDGVIEVDESELVAVGVVEGVAVGVVAEDEVVVVLEDFLEGEVVGGAVDAEETGNCADDDLVDAVVVEEEGPLLDDEADEIDSACDLSGLDAHLLAQLLSALIGVLDEPSQ